MPDLRDLIGLLDLRSLKDCLDLGPWIWWEPAWLVVRETGGLSGDSFAPLPWLGWLARVLGHHLPAFSMRRLNNDHLKIVSYHVSYIPGKDWYQNHWCWCCRIIYITIGRIIWQCQLGLMITYSLVHPPPWLHPLCPGIALMINPLVEVILLSFHLDLCFLCFSYFILFWDQGVNSVFVINMFW